MIVGIFHPALNMCGGAEWVAINIMNCVKSAGYRTILLTNEKTDQEKIQRLFGRRVYVDSQMVLPLEPFHTTDIHNIYTDFMRTLVLKSKCDILIDTYSNALLPGVDLTYIHFPFHGRIPLQEIERKIIRKLKNAYYYPYLLYEKKTGQKTCRFIIGNSKYTMAAIRKYIGATSTLLYPPIPKSFFIDDPSPERYNTVVSVDRIAVGKELTQIPLIARLTDKRIRFLMIGIKESSAVLNQVRELIEQNHLAGRVKIATDVPRGELQRILRTSKVFLHPAMGEHFGVSIAEAMASGCIPIVHDSGGPREFVPETFRFNSVEEAAKKIERAIFEWTPKNAGKPVQMAKVFSEEHFVTRFLKILNSYVHTKNYVA